MLIEGYVGDGVADPGPVVFDLPDGTWSSEFSPEPSAIAAASTPVDSGTASATPSAETASASASGQSDSIASITSDSQSKTDNASGKLIRE